MAAVGSRATLLRDSASVSALVEMLVHLPPGSRDLCTPRALFPGTGPTCHRPGVPAAASRSPGAAQWRVLQQAVAASTAGHVSRGLVDTYELRASASPTCCPPHTCRQPQLPKIWMPAHPMLAERPSSAARHSSMDTLTAHGLYLPFPGQPPSWALFPGTLRMGNSRTHLWVCPTPLAQRAGTPSPSSTPCAQPGRRANSY